VRRTVLPILVAINAIFICASARATEAQEAKTKALIAARAWLATIDQGKYDQGWNDAAPLLKNAVSRDGFAGSLKAVRAPLGEVVWRKVESETYATSLPGAPDGEYVVIRFQTRFKNKESAIETITPMRDKDGAWRVSGYYIK
jgi:Protein of unknown function (DUF4019)